MANLKLLMRKTRSKVSRPEHYRLATFERLGCTGVIADHKHARGGSYERQKQAPRISLTEVGNVKLLSLASSSPEYLLDCACDSITASENEPKTCASRSNLKSARGEL